MDGPDDFYPKLAIFLGSLLVLLFLLALIARWWRGFFREEGEAGSAGLVRRVLRNSLSPTVANIVNRVVDFAFAVVVLHYLGVLRNGYYGLAALLVGKYLTTITDFGLGILTTREVARDPAAANRYLSNTVLLRWVLSALSFPLIAAIIAIYGLTPQPLHPQTQTAVWLLAGTLFPASLAAGISSIFFARERMEITALTSLLTNVLKVFCGVGVLVAGWGVIGLAASALGVTLANAIYFLYLQRRFLFVPHLELDLSLWRRMVPEAFPLMLNSLLLVVFFRFDAFILQAASGARAVGAYDAAYKLPNAASEIPHYLTMGLFPLLSRYAVDQRERLERTYHLALKMLLILAFPVTMVVSVLSQEIMLVLGGSEYLPDSAIALAILVWFMPLCFVNAVTQYVLIALNRQRAITAAFVIATLFNIAANLFWIPRYGEYGYVAASVITIFTEAVVFVPLWATVRQELGHLPLWKLAWRPALATLAMGVPMVWLRLRGYWAPALAAGAVLYVGIVLLLRTFTAEEKAALGRLWPRGSKITR